MTAKKSPYGAVIASVPAAELLAGIKQVEHAKANDGARPVLASILMEERDGKLRLVTADNFRIAWTDIPTEKLTPETKVMLRGDDVPALKRFLADRLRWWPKSAIRLVTFYLADGVRLTWECSGYAMTVVAMDSHFPDYMQVLPKKGDKPSVVLNPRYIKDMAASLRNWPYCRVYITDPLKPPLFIGENGGECIMPIKSEEFSGDEA